MLTGRQNSVYRPLVATAWREHCRRAGGDPSHAAAREQWYRTEIRKLGLASTKDPIAGTPEKFDELCLHFATLAADDQAIGYWSRARERRALHVLDASLRDAQKARNYAIGIAQRMGLFSGEAMTLDELPAEAVLKVNAAVRLQVGRERMAV